MSEVIKRYKWVSWIKALNRHWIWALLWFWGTVWRAALVFPWRLVPAAMFFFQLDREAGQLLVFLGITARRPGYLCMEWVGLDDQNLWLLSLGSASPTPVHRCEVHTVNHTDCVTQQRRGFSWALEDSFLGCYSNINIYTSWFFVGFIQGWPEKICSNFQEFNACFFSVWVSN